MVEICRARCVPGTARLSRGASADKCRATFKAVCVLYVKDCTVTNLSVICVVSSLNPLAMRGLAAAVTASKVALSLQRHHFSTRALIFRRFDAKSCSRSIRTAFTSVGPALLLNPRAMSSQAEQFSLGWTGDQSHSAGQSEGRRSDGSNLRLQAQQVVFCVIQLPCISKLLLTVF